MANETPHQADVFTRDALQLKTAISTLARFHDHGQRHLLRRLQLPTSQAHSLESLVKYGPLSLSELAAQIHLDISTASRMIDILEEKELLQRSPDPEDARAMMLEVTTEGREKFEQIEAMAVERMKLLLGNVDPKLRQAAVRVVEWLAGNANGAAGDVAGGKNQL